MKRRTFCGTLIAAYAGIFTTSKGADKIDDRFILIDMRNTNRVEHGKYIFHKYQNTSNVYVCEHGSTFDKNEKRSYITNVPLENRAFDKDEFVKFVEKNNPNTTTVFYELLAEKGSNLYAVSTQVT